MKKSIFKKLGGLFLGLAMGLGVAVGVAGYSASVVETRAAATKISASCNTTNTKTGVFKDGTTTIASWTFAGTFGSSTSQMRANSGSTLTIGIESGYSVSKFGFGTNSTNSYLPNGTYSVDGGANASFSKPSSGTSFEVTMSSSAASSVVITFSNDVRLTSINITYDTASTPTTGYTVSFNNGGGTGSMTALTNQTSIQSAPTCTFTAPTNKEFSHWSTTSGGSAASFPMSLTQSITLYAVWKDVGGGSGGGTKTYQFITANGNTFGTSTSESKALNTVNWKISTATNLGSYNSGNYAGQQLGTNSNTGAIELETVNNWGEQSGTTWSGYKKVKKVYLWLNNGSGTVGTYDVKVDGTSCSKSGTVAKNSTAGSDYTKASKVTYTPQSGHDTGKIKINVTSSSKAIYFCAIEIECEEVAVAKYSVTNNSGDTVTFTGATGANAAQNDTDYTATIAAASGYNQVSISSIVVGSTTLTSSDYTFSGGLLTIPKAKINGDITITAVGSKASYTVSASGTGVTFASKPNASYMTEYKISFSVNEGYDTPKSVSVTAGGTSVSATLSGTEITVPAASVTGNLVITANATLHTYSLDPEGLENISIKQDASSSLKHGETFIATLEAVTGYTLDGAEISIQMDGTDITKDAYVDGLIMFDVTGDVVISGSAIQLQDSAVDIDEDEFSIEENDTDTLTVLYSRATLVSASATLDSGDDVVTFGVLNITTGEITLTPKARGEGYYKLTVNFVNNSSTNDTKEFDVYVEVYGDELTGISLSSNSGDYYLGDDLALPTVTAHYSLSEDQTVTASWDVSKYNKYKTGSYELIATYEGETATYTANVVAKEYWTTTPIEHHYSYKKLTSALEDYSGQYLFVYEPSNLIMDGSKSLPGDKGIKADLQNSDWKDSSHNEIIQSATLDAYAFNVVRIDSTDKYLVYGSGDYSEQIIYQTTNSNGIKYSSNPNLVDNPGCQFLVNNNAGIVELVTSASNACVLHYNTDGYFRFYKDGGQNKIGLYKLSDSPTGGETIKSDEKHPIRITEASCTAASKLIGNSLGVNDFALSVQYDTGNEIVSNIKPTSVQRKTGENTYSDDCTLAAGTNTYKLIYSVIYAGQAYSVSKEINVDAAAKTLTGISLTYGDNFKDAFGLNETFTHEDVIVTANYANGYSSEVVTSSASFSSPDMTTAGEKTITVTYQGMSETYTINVSAAKSVELVKVETSNTGATGIVVDELTGSFNGYVGNTVDVQLELKNFTNAVSIDEKEAVTGLTLSSASLSNGVWNGTITVSGVLTNQEYVIVVSEGSDSFEVVLTFDAIQDCIDTVEVTGAKTEYTVGDSFDSSMTVTAVYKSGIRDVLETSEYTVTGIPSTMKRGDYTIKVIETVDDAEVCATFDITVAKEEGLYIYTASSKTVEDTENPIPGTTSSSATATWVNLSSSRVSASSYLHNGDNKFTENASSITVSFEGKSSTANNAGSIYVFTLEALSDGEVVKTIDSSSYTVASSNTTFSITLDGLNASDNINGYKLIVKSKDTSVGNSNIVYSNLAVTYKGFVPGTKTITTYVGTEMTDAIYDFIKAIYNNPEYYTCINNGVDSNLEGWEDILDSDEFKALQPSDLELMRDGVVSGFDEEDQTTKESCSLYADFIEQYDYIVAKYPELTNYLKREVSTGARINPILALNNVDNSVWVISAVALVGLTAIGGYFFYRKHKEI